MRGLVLLVGLLAACDDAVIIEVTPAEGVPAEAIQLYIGLTRCDDCEGVRPPQTNPVGASGELLPGDVYFREDSRRTMVIREAKVENGVARFRIEPSDIGDRFETAIAVDSANRSAMLIPSLPLDEARVYKIQLVAADANIGPKPATADGTFVAVWKQATAMTPCMVFERWSSGILQGNRVFIVPETDPDCDELEANDCNDFGYKAIGVPEIEDASCTVQSLLSENATICRLGGPTCDDAGATHDCAPSDYCLPSVFCSVDNLNCRATTNAALRECLSRSDSPARLVCTTPMKPAAPGRFEPCGAIPLEVPLPSPLTKCVGPSGHLMLDPRSTQPLAFTEGGLVTTTDIDGSVTLDVHLHWDSSCKYKVDFGDGTMTETVVVNAKPQLAGLGQIWVQRSGGFVRKLLVPLVLEPKADPTCSLEPTCRFEVAQTDSLAQCAAR